VLRAHRKSAFGLRILPLSRWTVPGLQRAVNDARKAVEAEAGAALLPLGNVASFGQTTTNTSINYHANH
jgi:hypothetical protein